MHDDYPYFCLWDQCSWFYHSHFCLSVALKACHCFLYNPSCLIDSPLCPWWDNITSWACACSHNEEMQLISESQREGGERFGLCKFEVSRSEAKRESDNMERAGDTNWDRVTHVDNTTERNGLTVRLQCDSAAIHLTNFPWQFWALNPTEEINSTCAHRHKNLLVTWINKPQSKLWTVWQRK